MALTNQVQLQWLLERYLKDKAFYEAKKQEHLTKAEESEISSLSDIYSELASGCDIRIEMYESIIQDLEEILKGADQ